MGLILNIETATDVCAVSLGNGGKLILEKTADQNREHARLLTVVIDELLASAGYAYSQLDAIAVSRGPGSYTGLRIGTATAKGLCFALDKPLIAVDTLFSMAVCMKEQLPEDLHDQSIVFCPMIDARRMEVYVACYDYELNNIEAASALILNSDSFKHYASMKPVFFGDGAVKFESFSTGLNALFPAWFRFSSKGMLRASEERWKVGKWEDLAYFEPFYLKEFVAGRNFS